MAKPTVAALRASGLPTVASGCEHFTGDPDEHTIPITVAVSEGFCPYCRVPLEVLSIGPYCNCCKWYWLTQGELDV